jgi:mannose-6-phosphate isomerase
MDRLESLPEAFEWLLAGGTEAAALVARVSRIAHLAGYAGRDAFPEFVGADALPGSFGIDRELATVRLLAEEYPGDPGIVVSLLLNQVSLSRGEALYLPAGNIHAYLHGVGIELMAASDNVLRGGLTPKHVDVPELLAVLDFTDAAVPLVEPSVPCVGVSVYRPGAGAQAPDFTLVHVVLPADGGSGAGPASASASASADSSGPGLAPAGGAASFVLPGPGIALCTEGAVQVAGAIASAALNRGQSVYITPDEGALTFTGAGELFLATTR